MGLSSRLEVVTSLLAILSREFLPSELFQFGLFLRSLPGYSPEESMRNYIEQLRSFHTRGIVPPRIVNKDLLLWSSIQRCKYTLKIHLPLLCNALELALAIYF